VEYIAYYVLILIADACQMDLDKVSVSLGSMGMISYASELANKIVEIWAI
jgi:hypothetical protein